ncbi:Na+ H+ antiporter [Fusarium agapanthi]|uniref:Na+ H+ antiporter n=1 Tax=Fusarium agapanthi TaxID=1803897 RepID=A0A9P5ECW6_9HYPO|nr:Na+ H+ antiporter [Fusarium agapanthi]
MPMLNATPLQAFTAGAALCSTSLGTTFTILGTSGLSATRLGVLLTSAAMMDDLIGLIMVQVISNLGGDAFDAITVVRPVVVSLGFAIANPASRFSKDFAISQTAFAIHTGYLLGIVIGATFAGTSSLLAAYIAGATISWWGSDVPHLEAQEISTNATEATVESVVTEELATQDPASEVNVRPKITEGGSGAEIFHHYYETALQHILKPVFFASIGFSVPICLVLNASARDGACAVQEGEERDAIPLETITDTDTSQESLQVRNSTPKPEKALSLYPACIVGIGIVAQGEIGYLISALAESKGIFGATAGGQSYEIFLIITWAITLCTIIGPISVGLIVNRVRKLENRSLKGKGEGKKNVLGAWGVS